MSAKRRLKYEDIFEEDKHRESSEMTDLIEDSELAQVSSSQIVKGKVTDVTRELVTVDIGFKSEGRIPVSEFIDSSGNIQLKVGDVVEVYVSVLDSNSGNILLSRAKAAYISAWKRINKAYENNTVLEGTVVSSIKGGLTVDLDGIRAFMPASLADTEFRSNLDDMLDQVVKVKIVECNRSKSNIVVSRKIVIEEERKRVREEILPQLHEGTTFKGRVKNLADYGVFVDIGGIDGLVHVTDLTWGRIRHPKEIVSVGNEIEVVVLKYEQEKERLTLGIKQLTPDPWENITRRYSEGDRVKGRIVGMTDYGAFLEIEPGVEGMIHVSELSWTGKVKKPSHLLKKGDVVEAVILGLDTEDRKISLGLKQIGPNPWEELKKKYPEGTRIKCHIKKITDFGMFVDIGEQFDGLIRSGDVTWDTKAKTPLKKYKVGQEIESVVLSIDVEKQRLSLGIKQLEDDPWLTLPERYPLGRTVEGRVVKVADFGLFVELEPAVDGLVHISEITEDKKVGDRVACIVLAIDTTNKRISLSIKALKEKEERLEGDVKVSLGQLLQDKLSNS